MRLLRHVNYTERWQPLIIKIVQRILTIILIVTLLSACSQERIFDLSNNIEEDIKILLPEGSISFDVMNQIYQSPRQIELTQKFQNAIKENYEWFIERSSKAELGKPMPYHENLGLTKEEYFELQGLMEDIELISSGTVEYEVSHSKKEIRLIPVDIVNNETISINLEKNVVEFDGQLLAFRDTIRVNSPNNGFKSEWVGYQWVYTNPKDIGMADLKNLQTLEIQQYKFTVGFLKRTGKVHLQIKGREISNGYKTIDYELPLVEK